MCTSGWATSAGKLKICFRAVGDAHQFMVLARRAFSEQTKHFTRKSKNSYSVRMVGPHHAHQFLSALCSRSVLDWLSHSSSSVSPPTIQ